MWPTTALMALRLLTSTGARVLFDAEAGHVEVSWRCEEQRAGRCLLAVDRPREVVVWYHSSAATLTLRSADTLLHSFLGQDGVGVWARVEFPRGEGRLALTTPLGRVIWALDVELLPPDPAALAEARRAFDRGELPAADELVGQAMAAGAGPEDAGVVALALDLRQRIAFREGHFARGLRLAGRASAAYESMGWTSRRCELAFALAARHINARNDPERAGMVLREAADCVGIVPSLAAEYQYLNARVADMQGRWRDADAGYRQARRLAERLQRREDALGYLSSHYVLADALHDDAAVQEIEFEIERLSRDGRFDLCTYAAVWTNIGWIRLMRRQRGWDAPDPRPLFERARLAYEGGVLAQRERDRWGLTNGGVEGEVAG